jgi:hypothetical protein
MNKRSSKRGMQVLGQRWTARWTGPHGSAVVWLANFYGLTCFSSLFICDKSQKGQGPVKTKPFRIDDHLIATEVGAQRSTCLSALLIDN